MKSPYFFCQYSLCPIRAQNQDSSEMLSQLFFGEVVELIEKDKQWLKIRTYKDNYTGWVDEKFLLALTDKEMRRWVDNQTEMYDSVINIEGPKGPMTLTKGAFLHFNRDEITFSIGNFSFNVNTIRTKNPSKLTEIAMSYLNAPYLWGGKSLFGIDCSGFTQLVFRFLDKRLPRDAYQQAEEGMTVVLGDAEIGDLAFFANASGKITHVGIILENNKIIHAHGAVRLDELKKEGIFSVDKGAISHYLTVIKRY
jgi:hypothetical protein